jgi:hypothetical protein
LPIATASSSQATQAQTVTVNLPVGKSARNIKRVSTDNGKVSGWQINGSQIQVNVGGGAITNGTATKSVSGSQAATWNPGTSTKSVSGSQAANTSTATTTVQIPHGESCSSTYNDGTYTWTLTSQTPGSPNDTCNYSRTVYTCPPTMTINDPQCGSVTIGNPVLNGTTCNYSGTCTYSTGGYYSCPPTMTVNDPNCGNVTIGNPTLNGSTCSYSGTCTYGTNSYIYNVTVEYYENISHSYHAQVIGRNGRGVL